MRKTILLSVAGVIALCCAPPASARDDNVRAARNAAQPQAASDDPDRTICVRAQLSGSRLYRRICRTAREWQDLEGGLPEER